MRDQLTQDAISDALEGKTLLFSSEVNTKIATNYDEQYNKTASPNQLSATQFTKLFSKDMTPENQEKFLAEMEKRISKAEPIIEIYQQTTEAKNELS